MVGVASREVVSTGGEDLHHFDVEIKRLAGQRVIGVKDDLSIVETHHHEVHERGTSEVIAHS